MSESTTTPEISARFSPVRWFLNNAKWHGVEWWITSFGGVLLVLIILMTLFADRLAPYDPIKFVGAPFSRPRAQQSVIVLQENDSIRLFTDRARAVRSPFLLTEENAALIFLRPGLLLQVRSGTEQSLMQ